ncbi:hypothetical protein IAR55_004194 [Kwoniella newhampshirensis]|uniref:Uncharacterized protein n=1 Tax=Kwoniella newhampshirensis TaxID=1651941 RepID=A0AAW0YYZ1_9TREE
MLFQGLSFYLCDKYHQGDQTLNHESRRVKDDLLRNGAELLKSPVSRSDAIILVPPFESVVSGRDDMYVIPSALSEHQLRPQPLQQPFSRPRWQLSPSHPSFSPDHDCHRGDNGVSERWSVPTIIATYAELVDRRARTVRIATRVLLTWDWVGRRLIEGTGVGQERMSLGKIVRGIPEDELAPSLLFPIERLTTSHDDRTQPLESAGNASMYMKKDQYMSVSLEGSHGNHKSSTSPQSQSVQHDLGKGTERKRTFWVTAPREPDEPRPPKQQQRKRIRTSFDSRSTPSRRNVNASTLWPTPSSGPATPPESTSTSMTTIDNLYDEEEIVVGGSGVHESPPSALVMSVSSSFISRSLSTSNATRKPIPTTTTTMTSSPDLPNINRSRCGKISPRTKVRIPLLARALLFREESQSLSSTYKDLASRDPFKPGSGISAYVDLYKFNRALIRQEQERWLAEDEVGRMWRDKLVGRLVEVPQRELKKDRHKRKEKRGDGSKIDTAGVRIREEAGNNGRRQDVKKEANNDKDEVDELEDRVEEKETPKPRGSAEDGWDEWESEEGDSADGKL